MEKHVEGVATPSCGLGGEIAIAAQIAGEFAVPRLGTVDPHSFWKFDYDYRQDLRVK